MKKINCLLCPKNFELLEELKHHIDLDHFGISPQSLQSATQARETKKQLGSYLGVNSNGTFYECPECFDMFTDLDKLNEHRKLIHKQQFTDEAQKKLKEMPKYDDDTPPECEICARHFLALVICKMNGKAVKACLSCYESHYGINALRKLTIGTPENVLKEMRKPLVIK